MSRGSEAEVHIPAAAATAARSADAKLGQDTVMLAMGELFGVVDAFIITSAPNSRHVRTLVEEIERGVKELHQLAPVRIEGMTDATWVLMDYGDFIAHVFLQETREYYDLEHLWSGAPRVEWRSAVQHAG
ncbi:MAG TPA: ribosome silencing factor [Acidimicrobiales bacterium]